MLITNGYSDIAVFFSSLLYLDCNIVIVISAFSCLVYYKYF